VLFQPADNTRALSLTGNSASGFKGLVYAPAALLSLSGNANLGQTSLVVDRLSLTGNGASSLAVAGISGTAITAGELLGGDLYVYVNDPQGAFTPEEQARIQDAILGLNSYLVPYSVSVIEVYGADSAQANVVIDTGRTSAVGGYAGGVLGCFTSAGEITLIQGWDWYTGVDGSQVGTGQYDFQSIVTHDRPILPPAWSWAALAGPGR
jgi:hypothetical protein